jgi:hypothetical protein
MREPFGAFARAYLRYQQGLRPTVCPGQRLQALRALEMALCNEMARPQIQNTSPTVLNSACVLLRSHLVAQGAYAAARQLETLGRFLDSNGLVASPLAWTSPLRRPVGPRLGPEFEERRAKKLPSRAALEALAAAFNRASAPADVIVASAATLQFCAHSRICETLTIPNNCEVVPVKEGTKVGHALRWWPAKGGSPCLKWLLPSMAPIAAQALENIRRITEPARAIARWYEAHPGKLFLPRSLEHLRAREWITYREAGALVGANTPTMFAQGLPFRWKHGATKSIRMKEVRFADFESRVLSCLPREFPQFDPNTGLAYGEALFVIPRNLFRPAPQSAMTCMIERVCYQHIDAGLGGRSHLPSSRASLFERLNLTEDDGSPIRLPSHNIRHYLSDLAQRNQVSQLDLAAWAGRKPRQNLDYNHMSDAERLAHVRSMSNSRTTWRGPQPEIAQRMPVERSTFARFSAPAIHTTEIGYCLHDYAMWPCQLHRDCVFCTEHICIKGDGSRTDTVRRWLSENSTLLVAARKALSRRAFGADRWVRHCRKTVERLSELRALLEDPAIPDGTVIQLGAAEMPSRIRDAARKRAASLLPSSRSLHILPGRSRHSERP